MDKCEKYCIFYKGEVVQSIRHEFFLTHICMKLLSNWRVL